MEKKCYEEEEITGLKLSQKSIKSCKFIDCEFEDCKFDNLEIINSIFIDCKFINCDINNINSSSSVSKRSEFIKCNIIVINWNSFLPEGNFCEPISKLENNFMKFNNFIEMKFVKFDFSSNTIIDSIFEETSLLNCNFEGCKLDETTIINSDISKTNFCEATGYIIDILTNKMVGTKFSYPEVINLLNSLDIEIKY